MRRILRSTIGKTLVIVLALWWFGLSDAVDHGYWNLRFKMVGNPAPRDIVVMSLDDLREYGNAEEASILLRVRRMMPREVLFDAKVKTGADRDADAALASAVRSFGDELTFVVRSEKLDNFPANAFRFPPADIAGNARIAVSAWNTNFLTNAVSTPTSLSINGTDYTTVSAYLAHATKARRGTIYPDFSIDPLTIRTISARDLLEGRVAPDAISGRTLIISAQGSAPIAGYFGRTVTSQVPLDIAGAAALRKPFSVNLTDLPLLMLTLAALVLIGRMGRYRLKIPAYTALVAAVLVLPAMLRDYGIVSSPDVSICVLILFGGLRLWHKRTRRIQHTNVSGLPNLLAFSTTEIGVGRDVVVAVIARFEEMLATLPANLHGEFARQIARRIAAGTGSEDIYQGDSGHFVWSEEARPLETQNSHLEGLRALFSAPLQIGHHTFDTNIHFGLDRNEGLDTLTRVNSALVSANEALANGRVVELFEAHRLAEAPWELSLHARIDEGLRNGDIWLAFQPQWRFRDQRIYGAEALIRWNHPTRGPISPDAFILQAERAGRIDALTYWVLEEAITAALIVNAMGERFQMSVNLSAQMVDKADLVARFTEIVTRRGFEPSLLTIEITETSSVRNRPAACHNLTLLRGMGFRLSIDDFGTGEASLTYLADLPSDELKLDRRFVSRIVSNPRERAIVSNTIMLAHALGQEVVAEGIEDAATFGLLHELGCDSGQGYYLGRPQPFASFRTVYEESLQKRRSQ
ncbi:EAL domain-containing protein [Novosphingobium sediminis]|uniref:EAL domain-containing protein n=1 Tax=Novosphingobium sediminis TaxID=707214 RepID=UPI001FE81467|nr:EAL domain-containing protein [Novosphingobium sediminis]